MLETIESVSVSLCERLIRVPDSIKIRNLLAALSFYRAPFDRNSITFLLARFIVLLSTFFSNSDLIENNVRCSPRAVLPDAVLDAMLDSMPDA